MLLDFTIPEPGTKVLLFNTHAYDLRLPWSQWHQPTGLLQLGAFLKRNGCDVRLIDCLKWDNSGKIIRRKLTRIQVDDYNIDIWRFGTLWGHLANYVFSLKAAGWKPHQIYISCSQTHWWEAAHDLVKHARKWFPNTPIFLGGTYACLEPDHARENVKADFVIDCPVTEAQNDAPDIELYPPKYRPSFAGLYLYNSRNALEIEDNEPHVPRLAETVAMEVSVKASQGIREFAFFDDEIALDEKGHFKAVLQEISKLKLDVRFVGLGNLRPELIDSEAARLMYQVGYRQIFLKCAVSLSSNGAEYLSTYEAYRECVEILSREANFKPRTGQVTAMLQVGNPYENIEVVTERLIYLASIVGAVNLVQFQYSNRIHWNTLYEGVPTIADISLTDLNCKFYPVARLTGTPFKDYIDLTRLAALLSSKYRDQTFDFLESNLVASLVRESIKTQAWQPSMNGTHQLLSSDVIPLVPVDKTKDNEP